MSDSSCQEFFANDADITGIGVRVAFYLQVNLLLLLAYLSSSPEDAASSSWTLASMSIGLIIAAISQVVSNGMSFFTAVQVMNLVWYANFALLVAVARRETMRQDWAVSSDASNTGPLYYVMKLVEDATKISVNEFGSNDGSEQAHQALLRDSILGSAMQLSLVISNILSICAWAAASRFGPHPECRSLLKFYFIFWKASLSFNAIRRVAIAFYSVTLHQVMRLSPSNVLRGSTLGDLLSADLWLILGENFGLAGLTQEHQKPAYLIRHLVSAYFRSAWIFLWIIYGPLGTIPSLEFFLRQSQPTNSDADSKWTFGQILAVVSIIPTLVSVIITGFDAFKKVKTGNKPR